MKMNIGFKNNDENIEGCATSKPSQFEDLITMWDVSMSGVVNRPFS